VSAFPLIETADFLLGELALSFCHPTMLLHLVVLWELHKLETSTIHIVLSSDISFTFIRCEIKLSLPKMSSKVSKNEGEG
jgi:hypothetical protein